MENLYSSKKMMPYLALLCATLWALAYPFIKLGYRELGIASDDLGSKVLFAGIRFLSAGLLVLIISRKQFKSNKKEQGALKWLLLYTIINTTLHYLFSYVGLGYIQGSRGTVIDSTGNFMLILLSCMIFADDKMTVNKVAGCILGFSGILLINAGPKEEMFSSISFLGDGMIFLNALCCAFGGIIGRVVSRKMNMTIATGSSMAAGGFLLVVIGIIAGPREEWHLSFGGIMIIIVLILISAISFTVYNQLLAHHPISKAAIYNALIPVFGVIFSCIILGEEFSLKYLVAGIVVFAGIAAANRVHKTK